MQKADRQIEVLPVDLLPEFQQLKDQRRHLEARSLLVPIRMGQHFKALREGTVVYDSNFREWVTTLHYSSEIGLDS